MQSHMFHKYIKQSNINNNISDRLLGQKALQFEIRSFKIDRESLRI
jgi:hypothetical protein